MSIQFLDKGELSDECCFQTGYVFLKSSRESEETAIALADTNGIISMVDIPLKVPYPITSYFLIIHSYLLQKPVGSTRPGTQQTYVQQTYVSKNYKSSFSQFIQSWQEWQYWH